MDSDKHLFSGSIFVGYRAFAALLDTIDSLYETQYEDEHGNPIPASRHLADMLIDLASINELRFKLVTQTGLDTFEEYVLNEQIFHDHQANVIESKRDELIAKIEGLDALGGRDGFVSFHATVVHGGANSTQSQEGGDE